MRQYLVVAAVAVACGPAARDAVDGSIRSDAAHDRDAHAATGLCGNGAVDDIGVVIGSSDAESPHVVHAAGRRGLIWIDNRTGVWESMFAWLDDQLQPIAGTERVVSPNDGHDSYLADIAWSGSELGIVYGDNRNDVDHVYFARLDANGELIAGSERLLDLSPGSQTMPDIAWDPVHAQ
jgi:hypothetical protein